MDIHKNLFDISELIFRFVRDEISSDEKVKLDNWLNEKSENRELFNKIVNEENINNKIIKYQAYNKQKAWDKIITQTDASRLNFKIVAFKILKYAAILLIPIIIATYFFMKPSDKNDLTEFTLIKPGTQKAILTLENGQIINLGDKSRKIIITGSVSNIIDTNYTLSYEIKPNLNIKDEMVYNTLQTPLGGEYKLILADGSKIWLNAASEIKYPESFNDSIRKIFLKGEAYFEVAHNKTKPFIVVTNDVEITVLGTSFDVMAYIDENNVKTTLISGNVKIGTTNKDKEKRVELNLKPGQQAVLNKESKHMELKQVDTEGYTAWKDGKFVFSNESLDEIMRKLQRWYAFDVQYENEKLKNIHFSGTLKRYDEISNILKMIEMTTLIKFEVKGKMISIKKVNQ